MKGSGLSPARSRSWGLIPMASRMTVVRLNDGGLFVHSPVRLEPKLKAALDALGPLGM